MKKAILPVLLLTSALLPSLAKAELYMYSTFSQDGLMETRSLNHFTVQYPDKNYYGDGKSDDRVVQIIDHKGNAVRRYRISLETPRQARAFGEMLREGKVACLPTFRDGGLADLKGNEEANFTISAVPGNACNASDLRAAINARVETNIVFDALRSIQRGLKSAQNTLVQVSNNFSKDLSKDKADAHNASGRFANGLAVGGAR